MLVDTLEKFEYAIEVLNAVEGPLVLDTETSGLYMFAAESPARMVGIAIGPMAAENTERDFYFTFRHEEGDNLPIGLLQQLRDLCEKRAWLCHNASFDIKILHCDGFALPVAVYDTIVAAHLSNENRPTFALKDLSAQYFGASSVEENLVMQSELKKRGLKGKGNICKLPASLIAPYALMDIDLTRRLYHVLLKELETWRLLALFLEVNEFLLALIRTEIRGVLLDKEEAQRQISIIGPKIATYAAELHSLAGDININSPAQLKKWLKLESTAKPVLEEVLERDQRRDIRVLLDYRALTKAESTYFRPLMELADTESRIHTSYKVHGTVTGRLSSSEPNLQNSSRDQSNRGYSVRKCFVAPPGSFLVEADYSAIEPRIAAHYSKDPTMLEAFNQGRDFHSAVARSMYKKDSVSKEERTNAKALGLGILYGMGSYKAAVKLGLRHEATGDGGWEVHHEPVWVMSEEEGLVQVPCSTNAEFCTCAGRAYVRKFYEGLPELEPTIKNVRNHAIRSGYIRNPVTGRCSRFEGTRHPHKAFNSLIQQTAAEILRRAFTVLDKQFTRPEDPQIVLTVHDSIAFEVRFGPDAEEQIRTIKRLMEQTTKLDVPVIVDIKVGLSLGNLAEVSL